MKTKISLILAMMLATALPSMAHDFEVDGIYYNILSKTDKTVEVTYKGNYGAYVVEYFGRVTIPETVTYSGSNYFVTSIGKFAFCECSGLTEVTIPNTVTSIENQAFMGCTGLTELIIADGSTMLNLGINNYSQTDLGTGLFSDCPLKKLYLGRNLNYSAGTASWGYSPFYDIDSLNELTIGNSVTTIEYNAFLACSNLTEVTIGNSVSKIAGSAFSGCSVTKVNFNAYNCTSMGVFKDWDGLKIVNIGNSVQKIPDDAFYGCSGLIEVNITDLSAWLKIDFSNIYSNPLIYAHHLKLNGTEIINLTIPDEISAIKNSAFSGCSSLTSVSIPNSVTSIGNSVFYGCSGLTSVSIPNSVTSIGNSVFYGCSGLTSVTIGSGVLSIGENTFNNCNIKKVIWLTNTPPEGYKNVGSKAHYVSNNLYTGLSNVTIYPYLSSLFEVDGIKYVPVSPSERTCDAIDCVYNSSAANINIGNTVSFRGVEMTLQDIKPYICYNNDYITDCKINFTGNIGNYAFYDCDAISNAEINSTSIGSSAFYDCDAINNIEINATTIGESAFSDCDAITKVEINATAINSYAFSNSAILEAAKFIIEAETIGNNAFNGCSAIYNADIKATTINNSAFSGSATIYPAKFIIEAETIGTAAFNGCNKVKTITFSENLTSIGTSAFQNCSSLKGVVIPDGVTYLDSSAFSGCSSLASVKIGSGISALNDNTFYGCTSLPTITIPANVTSIGNYVFDNCTSLANVTIEDSEIIEEESQKQQSFPNWTSSNHDNNSTSSEEYNINVNPGDVLTFNYTVSSESNYDFLIVKLDGKEILKESGSKSGNYTTTFDSTKVVALYMEYTKDSSNSNGTDNAAVTDIMINGSSAEGSLILGSNGSSPLFSDCPLNTVYIGRDISYSTSSGNGYSPFYSNKSLKNVILKNETNLTDYEFAGCTGLESIDFGNSINQFGSYVFYNCSSLEELIIPNSVAEIGTSTFEGCSSLASVKIGSGISALNDNTFYGCTSLPTITIPANVASIGNNVFRNCSSLAEVTIIDRETELSLGSNGSNPLFSDCPLKSVYIGGNISYPTSSDYGYSPFYRNTSLETVVITDKETEISENEFYGCTALRTVSMGDGVETIGNWAFSGCSSLDSFSFGSGMKTIGTEAFSDCTAMTKLYSKATVPPTCGTQALDDINKWNCELYVPQSSIADYQVADQWKEFFFITSDVEEDVISDCVEPSIVIDGNNIVVNGGEVGAVIEVYNINGQLIYQGNDTTINVSVPGIYIVKVGGKSVKVNV